MTQHNQPGRDYRGRTWTMKEVSEIVEAVGPGIREGMKQDLAEQTRDIQAIVSDHEDSDNRKFSAIERKINKMMYSVGFIAGVLAVIQFIAPILVEWMRAKK